MSRGPFLTVDCWCTVMGLMLDIADASQRKVKNRSRLKSEKKVQLRGTSQNIVYLKGGKNQYFCGKSFEIEGPRRLRKKLAKMLILAFEAVVQPHYTHFHCTFFSYFQPTYAVNKEGVLKLRGVPSVGIKFGGKIANCLAGCLRPQRLKSTFLEKKFYEGDCGMKKLFFQKTLHLVL